MIGNSYCSKVVYLITKYIFILKGQIYSDIDLEWASLVAHWLRIRLSLFHITGNNNYAGLKVGLLFIITMHHQFQTVSVIIRAFPGGSVVRTPCFHCPRPRFNPWSENKDPKSKWCGQKKKNHFLFSHYQWSSVTPPAKCGLGIRSKHLLHFSLLKWALD